MLMKCNLNLPRMQEITQSKVFQGEGLVGGKPLDPLAQPIYSTDFMHKTEVTRSRYIAQTAGYGFLDSKGFPGGEGAPKLG